MGWIQTEEERVEAESPAEWKKRELPDYKQSKASVGNCKAVSVYDYVSRGGMLSMGGGFVMGLLRPFDAVK